MSRTKVMITGALHPDTIAAFKENKNFDLTYRPDCPRAELIDQIPEYEILITRSETKLDQTVLEKAEKLRL